MAVLIFFVVCPFILNLKNRGQNVHLANFSFSEIAQIDHGIRLTPTLVGVTSIPKHVHPYFPELYLSEWFKVNQHQEFVIVCFQKTGTDPLTENYHILANYLSLDGILLIDGGVDSLMRGDEAEKGTLIEDATSL